jgi:predicted RecB family nuclease
MIKQGDTLRLSASDLVGHLNCRHLTDLDVEATNGRIDRPHFHDPLLDILVERGAIHERNYLEHLAGKGYEVVEVEGTGVTRALADRTLHAMRSGAQVIAQAALLQDAWGGRADLLLRVPTPSALGDWSYEVIDTKLARETRGGTILQLSLYSDLLFLAQGVNPAHMHVVTPGSGFEPESYRTAAFAAYYRYVRRRLERSLAERTGISTYPDPNEHCEICRWRVTCDTRRRCDDHLCLVAGISKVQTDELVSRDIGTGATLARLPLPLPWKPRRGAAHSYERVREQARVQVQGREESRPVFETLPPAEGVGLARLPAPSEGDLFFDLEGDPFVGEGGLEYLFGCVSLSPGGEAHYVEEWAFTRNDERRAFRRFVELVMARWARYPDMHIYHYAPYEPGALKRLMGRYATCEDEIDRMLRGQLFVDLFAIVKQSLRASVESYTIKNLEAFYDYRRPVALPDARRALAVIQGCLELDDVAGITADVKRIIAGYNRDDCISALKLRDWLEDIRARLIADGVSLPRPAPRSPEPAETVSERQRRVAEVASRLTAGVPAGFEDRSTEQQASWILANVLDWHRRELKSAWWEYFRLAALPAEDLLEERCALSGLTFVETVAGGTPRTPVDRYRFLPQEVELRGGEALRMSGGDSLGKVEAISLENRTVDIRKRKDTATVHPAAVFAHDLVSTDVMADALLRIGEYVAVHGLTGGGRYLAARDVLLRRPPRLGGESLHRPGEGAVDSAVRIAPRLAGGVLAIQGPPGAGKTYTAARMICALVQANRRVGITANSHKVIRNLLDAVVEAADELRIDVRCIQKVTDPQDDAHRIRFATKNEEVFAAVGPSCQVAAGTAWLWSREDAFEAVDVLFVDEAAQMSLANVLAVSQACTTLVLLGDPQQLEQPMQGSHPEGTDVSALDHILAGKATIDDTEGLFLEETWRLHPDICAFTSELFYEGRLRSHAGLERQSVRSTGRCAGTGLVYLPVAHQGNQGSSPEEADRVRDLVNEILQAPSTWVDRHGQERTVTLEDILVIAPYNAQVFELQERLPGARIGTVDKFQGQEAPIVVYSMTTSSHSDAPRGMEFLYSLNRLNVATSRARCICILVGSPALFEPVCRTPHQMRMANAFCRYLELAKPYPH